MGAKGAVREPETISEKFLQAHEEVDHLFLVCSPLKPSMGRNAGGQPFSLVHDRMPASGSSSLPDKETVHISHQLPALLFI